MDHEGGGGPCPWWPPRGTKPQPATLAVIAQSPQSLLPPQSRSLAALPPITARLLRFLSWPPPLSRLLCYRRPTPVYSPGRWLLLRPRPLHLHTAAQESGRAGRMASGRDL